LLTILLPFPVLHSGINASKLPQCPKCREGLLRPDVLWFGEAISQKLVEDVDAFFEQGDIDLCIVIGTSGTVWPVAGYVGQARKKGARVAFVNTSLSDMRHKQEDDWAFVGDAAVVLPEILMN
jgi:NAD+-dependent protein deacetylase sirtuin 5